jgi:hypothetical protein
MSSEPPAPRTPVEVLEFATSTGIWVVRSASTTCYYVDADRGLLMRARGVGSQHFAFDDEWVPLVDVTSHSGNSSKPPRVGVRVGERPRYLTDPRGGIDPYEWRLQRAVTAIEPLSAEDVAALVAPGPDGEDRNA